MTFVVGLAGRIAAGKGEAAQYISRKYGAEVVRFSDVLKDVLEVLFLPNTRQNLQILGSCLRAGFGDRVLVDAMKARIEKTTSRVVVVDGVRYKEEAALIRSFRKNILLFIDAPLKIRYQRVISRGTRGEAKISFEEFRKSEEKETEKSLDEIKKTADEVIENTGSIGRLHARVDSTLSHLTRI
jgi:dephospho-CoA kinase